MQGVLPEPVFSPRSQRRIGYGAAETAQLGRLVTQRPHRIQVRS